MWPNEVEFFNSAHCGSYTSITVTVLGFIHFYHCYSAWIPWVKKVINSRCYIWTFQSTSVDRILKTIKENLKNKSFFFFNSNFRYIENNYTFGQSKFLATRIFPHMLHYEWQALKKSTLDEVAHFPELWLNCFSFCRLTACYISVTTAEVLPITWLYSHL